MSSPVNFFQKSPTPPNIFFQEVFVLSIFFQKNPYPAQIFFHQVNCFKKKSQSRHFFRKIPAYYFFPVNNPPPLPNPWVTRALLTPPHHHPITRFVWVIHLYGLFICMGYIFELKPLIVCKWITKKTVEAINQLMLSFWIICSCYVIIICTKKI